MQNVVHAYQQTRVGTTGHGDLVVMLYDGALRFLGQAREKMQVRDYAAKGILISRALDVINELDSSLNMEAGGELAQNLHNLYFLCSTRLLKANLKLDIDMLDNVTTILTGLRNAFAQIITQPEAQSVSAKIAANQASLAPRTVSQTAHPSTPPRMAASLYAKQENSQPR